MAVSSREGRPATHELDGERAPLAGPSPDGHEDQFLHILFIGLPMVYFATVVIPPVLFIKMLAQMRTLHRARLDDEELMGIWTRQDGKQT